MHTSSNKIVLSIVVPNYNHAHFLPERLPSLLEALPQNGELVFIDDGSTDNSLEIADRLAAQDPRLVVLRSPCNRGHLKALETAVKAAQGHYIHITAADDILLPGVKLFEKAMDALDAHPKIDLCFFDNARKNEMNTPGWDPEKIYEDKTYKLSKELSILSPVDVLKAAKQKRLYIASQAILMRKNIFEKHGFLNEKLGPLADLYLNYASALSEGAIYIPEVVAVTRFRADCYSIRTMGDRKKRECYVLEFMNLLRGPSFENLRVLMRKSTLFHDIIRRHFSLMIRHPAHYDFLAMTLLVNLRRRCKKHLRSVKKRLLWRHCKT